MRRLASNKNNFGNTNDKRDGPCRFDLRRFRRSRSLAVAARQLEKSLSNVTAIGLFGKYQLRTSYTLHHARLWNATDARKIFPILHARRSSHRQTQLVGLQGKEPIYGRVSNFWRKREEAARFPCYPPATRSPPGFMSVNCANWKGF